MTMRVLGVVVLRLAFVGWGRPDSRQEVVDTGTSALIGRLLRTMTRALVLAVFGSLVACGGHTVDQDPEDATSESLASDANVLDADAFPTLALDTSTCSTRPFTHTCADAGVEDFLQRMLRIDCHVPSGCSNEVTVSLDRLGCPVTVVLTEQGSPASFDDGACVEAALANERWNCPDASGVSTALDLGPACSN